MQPCMEKEEGRRRRKEEVERNKNAFSSLLFFDLPPLPSPPSAPHLIAPARDKSEGGACKKEGRKERLVGWFVGFVWLFG